jgi:GTPase Era involved in 16S rRNA processing
MLRRCSWRCSPASASPAVVLRETVERTVQKANENMLKPLDFCGHFVPTKTHAIPMVLMLGNHSAGKSTLINALLGIREQQTGVAPTDDGFTILRRGASNVDEDGPTAVTNPDYGFSELRAFGNSFVNRFRVKTRKLPPTNTNHPKGMALPHGMMIVDTPGMIDTPVLHNHSRTSLEGQQRGYDFLQVTRWFATRADVILLMFDPANPGTTGETLDVMQKSLMGQEHKFLILLNKVDMFDRVTDFARCYGTLCWNLSKNIHNKDIPRIYTTYTRSEEVRVNETSAAPLAELDRVRLEVMEELMRAPLRRLDNLLTESEEAARRVYMAATISNSVRSSLRNQRLPKLLAGGGMLALAPVGISVLWTTMDFGLTVLLTGIGAAALGISLRSLQQSITMQEERTLDHLDDVFEETFRGQDTLDVRQRWELVKPELRKYLHSHAVANAPSTSKRDLNKLRAYTDEEIPKMRQMVMEYKEGASDFELERGFGATARSQHQ